MVLIAGGQNLGGPVVGNAELYDPVTGTFTRTGRLNADRYYATATLLNNGMVLIAGGFGGASTGSPLNSAELYNPATGTFSYTTFLGTTTQTTLNDVRQHHTATLLNNGMVLIAGGDNYTTGILNSAELYDPATETFSYTNFMGDQREYHTATLLTNGMVLMAGGKGFDGNSLATAELYDPVAQSFSYTTGGPGVGLNTSRYSHTATLLNNGMVLMAGGVYYNNSVGVWLDNAELFDPATGIFTPTTGILTTPRAVHTATLLNNGMVLMAGGLVSSSGVLNSAELY
jgi:WD40 repeat protein